MKKLLALAVAIVLALGCVSAFAVSGPIEGVDYPELPDGTLHLTVAVPNWGTDQTTTRMQKLWQEKMEEYLGIKLDITYKIKNKRLYLYVKVDENDGQRILNIPVVLRKT